MVQAIQLSYHRFSWEFHMFFYLLLGSEHSKIIAERHCDKYMDIKKKP